MIGEEKRGIPRPLLILPVAAIILFVVALGAKWWLASGLSWPCPLIALFALPCPSCGSTRAVAALADFDLVRAFRFNPLLVLALGALLFAPFTKFRFERWGRAVWIFLTAAVTLNWIYLFLFLPR